MRSALLAALALAVIALDHATKTAVASHFLPGESRIVIPHVLYLTYVQNYHGAFGLFGTHPLLLTAAASAVLIGFYLWYRKEGAAGQVHVAFALIFGGAVGNIIDRLHFGYVHDFIDFRVWPVFNVADSAITIGVTILLLQMLVREKRKEVPPERQTTDASSAELGLQPADAQPHDPQDMSASPYPVPAEE
jgi:signal peptidase II